MDTLLVDPRAPSEAWLLRALGDIVEGRTGLGMRRRITAIGEYALACAISADRRPPGAWTQAAVRRLAEASAEPEIVQSLVADPDSAASHAWLVEALVGHGYAAHLPIAWIQDALALEAREPATARYPLARMQALYLHYRLAALPQAKAAPPRVPFAFRWPEGYGRTVTAIYELTHAVLFLSDFGRHLWPPGIETLAVWRGALATALGRAAESCVAAQQLDLVGEIALASHCLGDGPDPAPLVRLIEARRQVDGSVPSWPGATGVAGLYHGTLIYGLAAARIDGQAPADHR